MIESPTAADSITNKQSSEKSSIYHTCRSVLHALESIPGFDMYLRPSEESDLLTQLWNICKQGSSLCYLYNTLMPHTPITVNTNSSAANKSKAYVYHFIIACRDQLMFPEDTLFTVTDLYQNNTNGFVKVVNTVKRILDLLEEKGIISVKSLDEACMNQPKDMRDNVVFELLSTERKYVQDLEALQGYKQEVEAQDILTKDTMHYLFGNLNALVDFQRRFLIQIEDQASKPKEEQRFGWLFIQHEEAFSVYEPFCANFQIAQDLAVQEAPKLQKLAHIMSPYYELPAMLIKPIQRVCKYPLLIQQLVKSTPDTWPHAMENQVGYESIQRVTKKVNETKRVQENLLVVKDLKKRLVVDDQDTFTMNKLGNLLLHDKFLQQPSEVESHIHHPREMALFLFPEVILICKEIKETNKNTIKMRRRKEGSLVLRAKIITSRLEQIRVPETQGYHLLHLTWIDHDLQSVYLRCRNDEQLSQWYEAIRQLMDTNATKISPDPPRLEESSFYCDDEGDSEEEYLMKNRSQIYQYNNRHTAHGDALRKPSHGVLTVPTLPPLPRSPTDYYSPHVYPPSPSVSPSSWKPSEEKVWKEDHKSYDNQFIRARSQSTPNIQRPHYPLSPTPELPPLDRFDSITSTNEIMKIKVHYFGAIYVVVVPDTIQYDELQRRIESKIKLCGQEFETAVFGLKYEDEDGDLITISSSEDVQMGFENRGPNNTVNLYVTS
ncbi:hypothetical protein BDB01DRAFT_900585 [Pilobolus umbonatus]|nr:hypothetical protein BDB01DRAFT_900585 [Pilobolus umbonatus]